MKINEQVERVNSKEDLVAFINSLAVDLKSNYESWENQNLPAYLGAMASWIEDSDGYYRNHGRPIPKEPTWRNIAEMLLAAKMYE